ncbi:hypothetical protein HHI36_021531 [Cryptolaemus montrouzieri]|uniref:Uncharacterized protein n=1 Tax=Cryptolaemus montrouzieri TaxID=559131 RepID=A0ABD2MY03_9CUCU
METAKRRQDNPNDYFSNDIVGHVKPPYNNSMMMLKSSMKSMTFIQPATKDELSKIIRRKSKTTTAINGMSTSLLKDIYSLFEDYVYCFVNQCLEEGVFP